jgi:hypothetical protein
MVVLSVGLLGLAPLLKVSIDANSAGKEFDEASGLALNKVKTYETAVGPIIVPYSEVENSVQGKYTRSTVIADNTTNPAIPNGLNQVQVTVGWTDNLGHQQSISQTTYLQK